MAQTGYSPAGLPLLTLGQIFLRIGATAFGGLGTSLALVERELVTKRQWLTAADVTEALTYTKLLPGSTGPQVVVYLGYKLGGWSGSAVATGLPVRGPAVTHGLFRMPALPVCRSCTPFCLHGTKGPSTATGRGDASEGERLWQTPHTISC